MPLLCAPPAPGTRPTGFPLRLPLGLPDLPPSRVGTCRKRSVRKCQEKSPWKAANPRFPQGLTPPVASCRLQSETPRVGFEPTTNRLTAGCSTIELSGNRNRVEQFPLLD